MEYVGAFFIWTVFTWGIGYERYRQTHRFTDPRIVQAFGIGVKVQILLVFACFVIYQAAQLIV